MIMRWFYSFLLYLSVPFVLVRLLWRARRASAYAKRWPERFAHFPAPDEKHGIWIHAVSLGEVLAAAPLVKRLRERYPERLLVLTTTTPTGSDQVKTLFGEEVFHIYAPYDLPGVVNRFLDRVQPALAVMIETELWPNICASCKQREIPIVVANARLSAQSARGYSRFRRIVKAMLTDIDYVAAQSQADAERYIELGLAQNKVTVTGSIKFDLQIPASIQEQAAALRQQWGVDRPVFIAASTHEGEEEYVLKAFAEIRNTLPDTLLVIAPRHPERFAKVASLAKKQGYRVALRSADPVAAENSEVFIGDTLGELMLFYAAADLAFVGGSFVPIGGHNLLEPAAVGVPTLTGPYTFNFTEVTSLLTEAGACWLVKNSGELAGRAAWLLQHPEDRSVAGEQGRQVVERNRGALNRQLAVIRQALEPA